MNETRRLTTLVGLMAVMAVGLAIVSTYMFYTAYFEQQRQRLAELASSQAQLIETIARDAQAIDETEPKLGVREKAFKLVTEANKRFEGIGDTGEFVLAYLDGESMHWLSRPHFADRDLPAPVAYPEATIAAPLREAFEGKSGAVIGSDHRDVEVLAAYEPVSVLSLGIVAKMDMAEIRTPFIQAGALFSALGLLSVLLTSFGVFKVGQANIKRLKNLVSELTTSYETQELLVEERTAELKSELTMRELIEQSLLRAKREADAASRAKSEFLANMSHELRTPLNSIIGFSEVLKMEMFGVLGNDKYKAYAEDINRSGSHLLELINEILDVSKIEAGALSLDEHAFDLRQTVEDCTGMVMEHARQGDIEITCDYSDQIPSLIADPLRVKQMVLNLLTNSVKFTPRGGSVHVAVHAHSDAGMEIEVADTGIGIAPEDQDQVLQPFGQATRDASVATQEGTGLGLPMVKMLIELHGGSLKLTSAKGLGTQVLLRFPKERMVA